LRRAAKIDDNQPDIIKGRVSEAKLREMAEVVEEFA